jgi:hypothetical protein
LKHLGLVRIQFGREELCRPSDVDRLFGDLTVNLPALEAVRLVRSALPSSGIDPLASISPESRLRELDLDECGMDREGFSNLVSMDRHSNCPLLYLRVHPKEAGLDPDDCRLLCEGLCHNRHLRKLDVKITSRRFTATRS